MELRIVPLGGLGEIGLNMMVLEYRGSAVIVDAGLMFPEDYMLGIDFVIPDMDYIRRKKADIAGVILTHGHEDHIGALPFLLREINVPVYATPYTLGLIKYKFEEREPANEPVLHEIKGGDRFRLGSFDIETIPVSHSVIDGVGLVFRTELGVIVHTGDFKIGHTGDSEITTDPGRFAKAGDEGVLVLLSDSTNVESEGYTTSDREIGKNLEHIISDAEGRVIVALFASNIVRVQQLLKIAENTGRKVAFNGRSIEASVNIASELGYLRTPGDMAVDIKQVKDFPDNELIIITTGSQGEPMSALARMATGIHKQIKIQDGDTVILSSKFIPGNEKAITKIIDNLYRRGADVVYEKIAAVHASGHGFREELKLMIRLTKPRYFIPIHGEYRHLLLHARLAEQMEIPNKNIFLVENGQAIIFDEHGGMIGEKVSTGRVLIDGKGVGDVGRSVLKERRALSEDGVVSVIMAFDEETGIILYGPEIVSLGFVFETSAGHILEDSKCVILEIVEDVKPDHPNRIEAMKTRIQGDLRKYFNFAIKRRPIIIPFLMEV